MEDNILTENEEKALVGILYNHVSFTTTLEVFGEINEDGIKRLDVLRSVFTKLLRKYDLLDKLSPDTLLILGLSSFIKKEMLEGWMADDSNKHLQLRAKYFIAKQ